MDYLSVLKNVFPDRPEEQLLDIIAIIEESLPSDNPEQKYEQMVLLLSGDFLPDNVELNGDEAAGYNIPVENVGPAAGLDWKAIWAQYRDALPDADPEYLRGQAMNYAKQGIESVENFLSAAIETKDYPKMEEYIKRQKDESTLARYREAVNNRDKFLELFPNPNEDFKNESYANVLDDENITDDDLFYAKVFLYNKYPCIRKRHIDLTLSIRNKNLLHCCDHLDIIHNGLKKPRRAENFPSIANITLLKLVAFLQHRKIINSYSKYKKDTYDIFKEEARQLNLLKDCLICYDELIPEECFICQKGCIFCKKCLHQAIMVKMGDGEYNFDCSMCDSKFTMPTVQNVLGQEKFDALMIKVQSEEIRRANVDGMETCPFCDFTDVPLPSSNIFKCLNPDCRKESCRLCRHESHIPQRCDEIEYDEDVQRRIFIENRMTEALARTCYKCNKMFIKTTGCNKMICNCGAMMCYICRQPIEGYDHFGVLPKCPLHTDDKEIDLRTIQQWAEEAKAKLGNVKIKNDPSVGIENFYN
ncbi:uncharacterized protein LOC143203906 [Rhynchophorus ferrugineus]|uniref:uncharacterized protein LOC143203906 n=1 Tax=Rhynchophorus ferrugineus TaxID=354439 RepID=UPI003FCE5A7E